VTRRGDVAARLGEGVGGVPGDAPGRHDAVLVEQAEQAGNGDLDAELTAGLVGRRPPVEGAVPDGHGVDVQAQGHRDPAAAVEPDPAGALLVRHGTSWGARADHPGRGDPGSSTIRCSVADSTAERL
jgi:hypothetical protein